jgi:hypothetical protein
LFVDELKPFTFVHIPLSRHECTKRSSTVVEPPLTPLAQIAEFTEPIRAVLTQYWILSAEEFAATARLENESYGDGLGAMGERLALPPDTMGQLFDAAVAASPRAFEYTALVELDVGDGLLLNDLPTPEALDFAPPTDLPSEVLLPHLLPILDQGQRNTCVAFSLIAMLQILAGDPTPLSEQFLFWGCKALDGMPDNAYGTTPQAGIAALQKLGVCEAQLWPYNANPLAGSVGQGPPPDAAISTARRRRIHTGGALDSPRSAAVCATLAEGVPVLLGLPIYSFWRSSGQARRGGRIRSPLPGESIRGGHAVCAVGYREDDSAPGGGYIIFRNSWGSDFGSENEYEIGYGYVPFEVVDTENRCAYVVDALLFE